MIRRLLTYMAMMLGVVAFTGLFAFIFGNSIEVVCLREAGQNPSCRITRSLLGRFPISSSTLTAVTDVNLERDCDDGCTYQAVLVSSTGETMPVNFVSTDDFDGVQRQIDGISGFLASDATTFRLEVPVAWWVLWLTGGLGLIGMAALALNFIREAARG